MGFARGGLTATSPDTASALKADLDPSSVGDGENADLFLSF
jgi:hypothetical protein